MLLKGCTQYASKFRKLSIGQRTAQSSVFIPIPNYRTIVLISPASKAILKILQARLQQYVNQELPDVQVGFRKGRETRDQIANVHWIMQESSRRTSTPASLTMPKSLYGSQQTVVNSSRDGNTRPPYLPPKKPVCRSRSNR